MRKIGAKLLSILIALVMIVGILSIEHEVYAAEGYSAKIVTEYSTSDFDLGTAHLGYAPTAFQEYAVVDNTGVNNWNYDENSISISGTNADSFSYGWSLTTVGGTVTPGNSTSTIYVRPVSGLGVGTYTATLTFKDTAGTVTETASISFVVSDAPEEHNVQLLQSGDGSGIISVNPEKGITGAEVTLTATPKPGSKFIKWIIEYGQGASLSSETSATTTLTIGTTHVRVNAVFDIDDSVYVVNFYRNGGTGTMESIVVPKNSDYTLPTCAFTAPSDKEFDYWLMPGSIHLPEGGIYTVTSNITVTAMWKDKDVTPIAPTITTTALSNGKVGTSYNQSLTATGDATIIWTLDSGNLPDGLTLGTDGSITGTPTTAGNYTFTVKATNSAGNDTEIYTVAIAAADIATYTVSFDANSGSGTIADITVNEGEKLTLPDCTFTPPSADKEFDKWDAGNPGEQVDITSDCVIRAIWKDKAVTPNAPTITTSTMSNGKVGTSYNQSLAATGDTPITWSIDSGILPAGLTLGTDGTISGTPTTAGDYTFTVKATNTAGDDTKQFTITIAPADAVTYTVTFDVNGHGTAPAALTVISGSTASKPSDPAVSGWTFGGWYQDATCSVAFDFATPITTNVTLYAKWTEDTSSTVYYTVVGGGNSSFTSGNASDIVVTVKRSESDDTCFSHFTGVQIDGTALVNGTDYTAVAGSTVITIKKETLNNLSEGGHTINVLFDDGKTETSVTVKAAGTNSNSNTNGNKAIPATGETLAPTLFVGIAFVAVAGMLFAVILVQKKRKSVR